MYTYIIYKYIFKTKYRDGQVGAYKPLEVEGVSVNMTVVLSSEWLKNT